MDAQINIPISYNQLFNWLGNYMLWKNKAPDFPDKESLESGDDTFLPILPVKRRCQIISRRPVWKDL
jgi:hypothetical protein